MSTLKQFYQSAGMTGVHPSEAAWKIIDPAGSGDFTSIEDCFVAGHRNMYLKDGTHVMTADLITDLETERRPLRIHGEGTGTTHLQMNDGTQLYSFAARYDYSFNNANDYALNPPGEVGVFPTISCSLGSNKLYLTSAHTWTGLQTAGSTGLTPYYIRVGDWIAFDNGKSRQFIQIKSFIDSTTIELMEHNNIETVVDLDNWTVNRPFEVEISSLTIFYDAIDSITSQTSLNEVITFDHKNNFWQNWGVQIPPTFKFTDVDYYGGYSAGLAVAIRPTYSGYGAGKQEFRNFNILTSGTEIYISRATFYNCYLDDVKFYANTNMYDCIIDQGGAISFDDNCFISGCRALNAQFDAQYGANLRVVGCIDKNGKFDDDLLRGGATPEQLILIGTGIDGFIEMTGFAGASGLFYETYLDSISNILILDSTGTIDMTSNNGKTLSSMFDFRLAKRYGAFGTTFAQDGTTDDTIMTIADSIFNNSFTNLQMILYSGTGGVTGFNSDWVAGNQVRIKLSWTAISSFVTGGFLDSQHSFYFPYVWNASNVDLSGKKILVQLNAAGNASNTRLNYYSYA